ncbi:hypothetical protein LXL04_037315 [Taraxacum kok-saghyz]
MGLSAAAASLSLHNLPWSFHANRQRVYKIVCSSAKDRRGSPITLEFPKPNKALRASSSNIEAIQFDERSSPVEVLSILYHHIMDFGIRLSFRIVFFAGCLAAVWISVKTLVSGENKLVCVGNVKNEIEMCYKLIRRLGRGVVYLGSARMGPGHEHYIQTQELAREASLSTYLSIKKNDLNCNVPEGAGPGLMDAATRGALEAGKPVGGFKIAKEAGEWTATNSHPYLPSYAYLTCRFFSARKHGLVDAAVRSSEWEKTAVIVLPGGIGTLDEAFEILALIQLERIGSAFPVPFILMNYDSFYSKLLEFVEVCEDWGTVYKGELSSLWKAILNFCFYYTIGPSVHQPLSLIRYKPSHVMRMRMWGPQKEGNTCHSSRMQGEREGQFRKVARKLLDVGDLRAHMDTMQAAMLKEHSENAEFRKKMFEILKPPDKPSSSETTPKSGSGVFTPPPPPPPTPGDTPPGGDIPAPPPPPPPFSGADSFPQHPPSLPWTIKKVKLPEFNGFDPQGWIQKADLFFDMNGTPPQFRLRLAQLSMLGVAQHWFTIVNQLHPTMSWEQFKGDLLQRFSGLEVQNPYEQLSAIHQSDSMLEYIDDFEYLLSLVPKLPDSQAIGYFVAGLKDEVKRWVRLHRPRSTLEAMYLAKDVEDLLRPSSGNVSQTRFRYANRPGLSAGTTLEPAKPLGRPDFKSPFPSKWGDKPVVNRSDTNRQPPFSKPVITPSADVGQGLQRDHGMRSLTRTEWEDRRRKGLCFRCGQQYGPAHKCPEAKLRILLLGDDEYGDDSGEQLRVTEVLSPDDSESDMSIGGTCSAMEFAGEASTLGEKTLKFDGEIHSIPVVILVDSGASHNFISRNLVVALNLMSVSFAGIHIKLGDGFLVRVTEKCVDLEVSIGEVVHNWAAAWMKFWLKGCEVKLQGLMAGQRSQASLHRWLPGHDSGSSTNRREAGVNQGAISHMALTTISEGQEFALVQLLEQFEAVFQAPTGLPPSRSHDHGITLLEPHSPICVRPYRYPYVQKTEIEKQVQELLSLGMIRPSKSAYSSPVILVRKKDDSWRMCVDYRALNKATVPDKFPIPVVDELLDELHGACFFTKLDLKSGYNQIRMREDSIEKTAFRTHEGHYEYLVMPFGLMNAPSTFQAIMNEVFRPLLRQKVVIFFDDILVYSATWEAHLADLHLVLSTLVQHQFMVNRKKCSFGQSSIEYLGHVIDGQGVAMDRKKVEAGKDAFTWHTEAQSAFDLLKQALVTALVLALPDFSHQFVVECDASGRGIGAVLMQHSKPIAFFSKALSDRNLVKSAYEREIMALVLAVQHWRSYLLGTTFVVYTDQKSLRYLLQQRITTPDQQNWVAKLLGYSFEIQYKPGRENRAADALSRRADGGELKLSVSAPIWVQGVQLIQEAQRDPEIQKVVKECQDNPIQQVGFTVRHGILYYKDRLVIARQSVFIPALLHEFHVSASGGHSGYYRTYRRLASNLYWPGMIARVKEFVRACDVCQRCKASSLVPGGLLQPLAIPEAIWEELSMDFITGLPKSKGFDTILVVVDRLSKYSHFLLLKHPYTAKTVAELFVREIVRLHGIPKSIVSDRDPLFISNFWKELFHLQGTQLNMSSAYHPESDGQTEVINRCLEAYLRCFAVDQPRTWARWVPWAEFWYNSTFHASTGLSPFEVVYGRKPPTVIQFVPGEVRVQAVATELQDRDETLRQLRIHLGHAKNVMKSVADKKRRDVHFLVGEWVYVKLKPYRQMSVSNRIHQKLSAKFFGPFQIEAPIGPVAYKLSLPPTSKVHPVFHVSLLKKVVQAPTEASLPPDLEVGENDALNPKAILAKRLILVHEIEVEQWLIQWEEQSEDEATWEDALWVQGQFPNLSLEDKTRFQGQSSDANEDVGTTEGREHVPLITYARRKRRAISESG